MKLPKEWVEKADVFLEDAEKHMVAGHFWLTCFEAHQAAELYLKALVVAITGFHPYTNDLSELLDVLGRAGFTVDKDVVLASELLTPHYTLSRYPGKRAISYTGERAKRCLQLAKLIIDWVRRVADP